MTGCIARHQKCVKCGEVLSRIHATECSGVFESLSALYGIPQSFGRTILDKILNRHRNRKAPKSLYPNLANAVGIIFKECLGYTKTKTGDWINPKANENLEDDQQPKELIVREKLPNIFKRNRGNRIG